MSELKGLQGRMGSGRITRRSFLGQSAALGVAGTGLLKMAGPATAAESSTPAVPTKGGHLRFAIGHGATSDVLDPGKVLNGFLSSTHYAVTNTLTEVDADGKLLPKLAESWEPTADAKTWSFKLRPGVEFHDGRSLKPDDVIASINHHRGADSQSSAKTLVDPITAIVADGDRVTVTLAGGDVDFPFKLSSFNFPIYPANADGSLDWQGSNGAGAYRLVRFAPGERAEFERNPNHWQQDRGHFESGELIAVADSTARQNALITGEVDGIDRVEPKIARRLGAEEGVALKEVASKTHYTFPMRTDMAPFDNRDVRLAMKHAVDREALLRTILHGYGTIGNDQPVSSAYPTFDPGLQQRSYDPDRARHHLAKAGLSDLTVTLTAADAAFSGAVDAAVLFSEHASKAGIAIEVERVPNDGYWSEVWMKRPFCACYWPGYPTADSILTQAYAAGAPWNDTFWDHERFNELLVAARSELDADRRAEMYAEMQLILNEDGGVILPFFASDLFAVSDRVGHGALSGSYEVDGRMFFERWWFQEA
ncbi:MAG: ABC transporter substrate-binding protein [Rhodospirillales bacterium]